MGKVKQRVASSYKKKRGFYQHSKKHSMRQLDKDSLNPPTPTTTPTNESMHLHTTAVTSANSLSTDNNRATASSSKVKDVETSNDDDIKWLQNLGC